MIVDPKALKFLAVSAAQVRADRASYACTVPSPCLSVCQMDAHSGLCQGCLRTLEEVTCWGAGDDDFKRDIWARIENRIKELQA